VFGKGGHILRRAVALRRRVTPWQPEVALGHNSYGQILCARLLGIPAVTMMDFEHQPANHLAFRLAAAVLVPDAFDRSTARRLGAKELISYPGLKEQIALSRFEPDPGFRSALEVRDDVVLATFRPPPEGALYHRRGNGLFDVALRRGLESGATVVLSPRDPEQSERYRRVDGVRVLDTAVRGADLLYHSDVVVGAGGTMTREAAVLGTPSYSLFAGRLAGVDRWLIEAGSLLHLRSPAEVERIAFVRKQRRLWVPDPSATREVAGLIERFACRARNG